MRYQVLQRMQRSWSATQWPRLRGVEAVEMGETGVSKRSMSARCPLCSACSSVALFGEACWGALTCCGSATALRSMLSADT